MVTVTLIPDPHYKKDPLLAGLSYMAGGPGFEPGLAESESAVLPLDDPPVILQILQ